MIVDTNSPVRTAESDIECYKVVCERMGKYHTPFFKSSIEIGSTYTSELLNGDYKEMRKTTQNLIVGKGLHSFDTMDDAEQCMKELLHFTNIGMMHTIRIIKCIIPKGSRLVRGKFWDQNAIASDTLKYVEVCA